MKVFKDVFSGDEIASDSFPYKEIEGGLILEFETKMITRDLVGSVDIGANASAEGGGDDEGVDDGKVTVNNLVDAVKLVETVYDKKSYLGHIKAYLKRVSDKLAADGKDVKAFQAAAQEFVKKIIAKFDDYAFYTGETMDPEAMVVLKVYKEDGIIPYFLIWKDGVKEEKF
jgi:hypothetical protein